MIYQLENSIWSACGWYNYLRIIILPIVTDIIDSIMFSHIGDFFRTEVHDFGNAVIGEEFHILKS